MATAGTATAVLDVARRNLGVVEGRNNSQPYAAIAGHANNQPWCATFMVACARKGGVKLGNESAYTPSLYDSMTAVARKDVRPGDLIFFYYPEKGRIAHVGIVEAVHPTYVVTIEGNTDVAGGRTGGQVMRKARGYKNTFFTRPKYKTVAAKPKPAPRSYPILRLGNVGQQVLNVQTLLGKHGIRCARDGKFGPATKKAVQSFQKKRGLLADGIVGKATHNALRGLR